MAVSSLVRIVAVFGVVTAIAAKADEGMWTFNNFPSAKVAKTYGFAPDQAWLDNVRLSSVRLARGCSGSIVSASGLVMTNNHCARSCIQQLSTAADDRVQHGFYASRAEDEVKCPDIEINQLVEIGDVTKRIQDKLAGLEGAQFAAAYKVEAAAIAEECSAARPAIRCDVVDLYRGGLYQLYKYRRYQDVRLVFAPELAIAFFGGDPDNFEFPRYDLDVSYLRIYDNGKPLAADHYLRYAAADLKDGELTFVSGNPGATSRLDTVAQLGFARDVVLPANLYLLAEQRGVLEQFSAETPEHARIANNDLLRVENSYKGIKGRFAALVDPAVFQAKRADEDALRAKVAADPDLGQHRPCRRSPPADRGPVHLAGSAGRIRLDPADRRPRAGSRGRGIGQAGRPAAARIHRGQFSDPAAIDPLAGADLQGAGDAPAWLRPDQAARGAGT
jgi:hypothetical protein